MRDDLDRTPLHRSLTTPVLIFGIEREVVVPLLGLASMLIFAYRLNFVTPALAVAVLVLGLPVLRRMNRRDPWAFRVLRRHIQVSGFYPPLAGHRAPRRRVPTL